MPPERVAAELLGAVGAAASEEWETHSGPHIGDPT